MRSFLYRVLVVGILLLMLAPAANAFELPSENANVYIQTSGPGAGLNIGDYYTNFSGQGVDHEVQVYVPCAWNNTLPLTFAIYDPESAGPNPIVAPGSPSAEDEVRDAPDDTTFTLTTPNGTVITETYSPFQGTNGLWVELITTTLPATGCGIYTLTTTTSTNDDNAWRLRIGNDPDCTVTPGTCTGVGAATSDLLGDDDLADDGDSIPGTGDELVISFTRLSQQHQAAACTDYFMFVDGADTTIELHNFDFDDPDSTNPDVSITYFPPDGSSLDPTGTGIEGTESGSTSWNDSPNNPGNDPNPPRTGDAFTISEDDIGWWRTQVCMDFNNQYIFEGIQDEPLFFEQPPFPIMTLSKDNGRTQVSANGEQVTYTINYANINPVGAPNFGGAAIDVTIEDTFPAGATFVSCSAGCVNNGTSATWNVGTVTAPPAPGNTGSVTLTLNLPPAAEGTNHTNTVTMNYTGLIGANYPPVTAQDVDLVIDTGTGNPPPGNNPPNDPPNDPPTGDPGGEPGTNSGTNVASAQGLTISKSVTPPFAVPGDSVSYRIVISNTGSTAVGNVGMTDTLPDGLRNASATATSGAVTVNGQQVSLSGASIAPGSNAVVTINAQVAESMRPPFTLNNTACLTDGTTCDGATLISITTLPATGESPWTNVRLALLGVLVMGLSGLAVGIVGTRPKTS